MVDKCGVQVVIMEVKFIETIGFRFFYFATVFLDVKNLGIPFLRGLDSCRNIHIITGSPTRPLS